jgi:hypothetical protein
MYVSGGHTYVVKKERSWLVVDRWGRRSSKGVDCDTSSQGFNRIDIILIPPRYTFFSRSIIVKNSDPELSVLGTKQF